MTRDVDLRLLPARLPSPPRVQDDVISWAGLITKVIEKLNAFVAGSTTDTTAKVQMVATRCGVNASAGGAQFSTAQPGCITRMQHCLPYGAKSLFPIYSCFDITIAGSGAEKASIGGYGFYAISAVPVAGGGSYAVGDTITVSGVATNQFAPTLMVTAVAAGAVTGLSVVSPGGFGAVPAAALTTTKITGSGNNALTVTLGVAPCSFPAQFGLEQEWNQQNALASTRTNGVMHFTAGADIAGGKGNIVLPFGDYVIFDPLNVGLAKGALIGTRLYTPGTGFYVGRYLSGTSGLSEAGHSSINIASANPYGGTFPTYASPAPGFQPIAIMGIPEVPGPTFVIIGDSIGYGSVSAGGGTSHDTLDAYGNSGYIERAIAQAAPFSNFSTSGARCDTWLSPTGAPIRFRLLNMLNASHVVDELGINDLVSGAMTYANFKAMKIKFWQMLRGIGVNNIWATCLTPNTTSTDVWATLGNQTVTAASANIISYNTDLRAGVFSDYIDKVLDCSSVYESSLNSGKWKVGATGDGLHPSQSAVVSMAAYISRTFAVATL